MSLTVNFTSSESLSSPELITFTDISTGSDLSITGRRIYVQLYDGSYLPSGGNTDYISWSYSDGSIEVDLLTKSTTANVRVDWMAGSTVAYTKTILTEWDLFDYLFLFGLLSSQTSSPAVSSNTGYYPNSFKMITNLFQSESAVNDMDDLYSSQAALDRNQLFINNENLYF